MPERLDPIAARLGALLMARGLRLVAAESCTGGWIAKVVTDIAGSSAWFDRGFVTYSNAAKADMLGVRAQTLDTHGAVSEPVVLEMVAGALGRSQAQVAVAVSGVAGPGGGSGDKPVGTVWFAWSIPDGPPLTQRLQFAGDRDEVRHQAVRVALEGLLERLPVSGRTPG
ncbi:MAG TPA: nicotinamide-nucleotide amidase [Lamprocystis sp. (in: g-proteobacteria)]|nr:nicotinamide-nucleotide amidase [Lamprocystis sp. (in: g-proteobacteria)]